MARRKLIHPLPPPTVHLSPPGAHAHPANYPQGSFADSFNEHGLPTGYLGDHLHRLVHSMVRMKAFIKPGASVLCVGEKGHVPVLVGELLAPQRLEYTSLEDAGECWLNNWGRRASGFSLRVCWGGGQGVHGAAFV